MSSVFLTRWARLYSNPTPAEEALEPAVASLGVPYRFQHPLWGLALFPDFVLPRDRVVLEVDDPSHSTKAKKKADAQRTDRLVKSGWRVARCTNDEALTDPRAAVDRMMTDLGLPHRTRPSRGPKETP